MNTTVPGTEPPAERATPVLLKSADGHFVSCELGVEGADHAMLVANRTTPGDWERFTLFTKTDGRISLKAANGKFLCADDYRSDTLVADRDTPGDWESFTMEPQPDGKVLLKTHEGRFVSADLNLQGNYHGRLVGDRTEAGEWEQFTIFPDTTVRP